MIYYHPDLQKEYDRCVENNCLDDDCPGCSIQIRDVLSAHFSIVDYFLEHGEEDKAVGGIGPRDFNLLVSAVLRQCTIFDGKEKWKDDFEKCATLLYGLIKNHAFHDCNKRTAILTTFYYLYKLGRVPKKKHRVFEKLTIDVAENKLATYDGYGRFMTSGDPDILFLSFFLKKNTRNMDKNHVLVTYHQLNSMLMQHDFMLSDPGKGFINIVRLEKKRRMFGIKGDVIEKKKVSQIAFTGWTREVPIGYVRRVRRDTGLTAENGYDSQVFFRGADPLKSLINEYSGMLKRLSKK